MASLRHVGLALAFLAACGSDPASVGSSSSQDGGLPGTSGGGGGEAGTSTPGAASNCGRVARPADRARKVIVAHPYNDDSSQSNAYEVLDLSRTGELTRSGETFTMRRSFLKRVVFTPDGEVGLVAQDDGSVGVFTFDRGTFKVRVLNYGLAGGFYAHDVVVSANGERAWVVDRNTKSNNGGIYELAIDCEGNVTSKGLVIPGGRAHTLTFLPNAPDRALLVAYEPDGTAPSTYAHLVDFSGGAPAILSSTSVFPDTDAIASWTAITPDGKHAIITDNGLLKGNRMAPVALDPLAARAVMIAPNPAAVLMSPYGNSALLLSSDGDDHLSVVSYDPNAAKPFDHRGEVVYVGGKTQLPFGGFVYPEGPLKGRVLVAENTAIRTLQFAADGSVTDLSTLDFGSELSAILGAFGVQP